MQVAVQGVGADRFEAVQVREGVSKYRVENVFRLEPSPESRTQPEAYIKEELIPVAMIQGVPGRGIA
jgi:hypothetical protein